MTTTTALLLDKSDWTKDNNLKQEAFMAVCAHDVVLYGNIIIKCQRPLAEPDSFQAPLILPPTPSASSKPSQTETPPPSQDEIA